MGESTVKCTGCRLNGTDFASISSECTKKQMSLKKNDKNNGKKGKNLTETEENGENSTKYVGDIRDI